MNATFIIKNVYSCGPGKNSLMNYRQWMDSGGRIVIAFLVCVLNGEPIECQWLVWNLEPHRMCWLISMEKNAWIWEKEPVGRRGMAKCEWDWRGRGQMKMECTISMFELLENTFNLWKIFDIQEGHVRSAIFSYIYVSHGPWTTVQLESDKPVQEICL